MDVYAPRGQTYSKRKDKFMDTMNSAIYIENDRLFDYAAAAARLLTPGGERTGRGDAHRMQKRYREIKHCHAEIARRFGSMPSPPAACEWLLDNWYMIEREYRASAPQIVAARRLRRCTEGTLPGALARTLLLSGRGEVTAERFGIFLKGFQSVTVLRRAELCLLPAYLSAAVIESVAGVCREMRYASETEDYAKRLEALFGTLRLFAVLDTEKLVNAADVTGGILARDPAGEYARMDAGTKLDYLRRVEALARREGVEEHVYARRLIKRAAQDKRHIGFYLFPARGRQAAAWYIGANVLTALFMTLLLAFMFQNAAAALLLLLPVSELVKSLIDFILLHIVRPRRLMRMDMRAGVPEAGRTVCVISTLLGGETDVKRLEELYRACVSEGVNLSFGLLADLPVADSAEADGDEALIRPVREAVTRLNRRYGGRFYLFTRGRSFDGERYSPRERKRGAIMELAKLICDEPSELEVTGERDALIGTKYILTLDSDTRIYPGAAGELIGAMLHPLNRPVIDARTKTVTAGHAIVHPRIDTELSSSAETDFALIFAGAGGSDPYGSLCGELYMDAFSSGGFAGKGVIDARALLECTRSFPEGRILSHDAPEGAYLRGAYMGDAEFSDCFPAKPLAYYKRQHRWIRGDWQNIPFIFVRGLSDIDRWRLIDSLRRSLIAPATLAAITAGFFLPGSGLRVAAWAALLALLARLFLSLAEGSMSRRGSGRIRRYTRILSGVGGAIVQTFIRLWLLPYEAWISLTAIAAALWRMLVSKRRLLQWQTAAQAEGGGSLARHVRAMYFPVLLGLALTLLCPAVIGKSAGLMWLLSPAAAFALSLPAHREAQLAENERQYLIGAAKRSFAYFESFFSAEDSFLPPDNFQEQPPVGLARRTSPTNIGLALAAHTAAADMGIISPRQCAEYTARVLDTLERMPRHRGHFYNWYDTATLMPLLPAYISTVDSGNMYAGLLTARQAMLEYGEGETAARLDALMAGMDFAPLYDGVRGLFHICYDTEKERGAGGWYDLMASEAMLTSYIAAANGDVPVKHWRRLSRAQLQKDGYRGLASWTGTMFEYLMPELFLPVYRGSLLYESVRFCLYAQKRRVWAGKPWGISESAFYSLDSALNYRYRAHGCAALALKRGQDADMVVSPYSSFLALAVDPEGGVRNLRRLEDFGALGRWGFIEALDFTPGRCRSDRGEQVRCYMAHHIGMSVIAAANAACGGSVQRRFMSAPDMAAFSLLLQERVGDGGVVIRRDSSDVPERGVRSAVMRWQLRGGAEDTARRCCVLSNGAYSILASNRGHTRAQCGSITIYDCAPGLGAEGGISILLDGPGGERQLLPTGSALLWELEEEACRITGQAGAVEYECTASAAYGDCGELRTVTLCAAQDMRVRLSLCFKPLLAPIEDYVNHVAFWELGMKASEEAGMLKIHRLKRSSCPPLWLCVASGHALSLSADRGGGLGWLSHPYVRAEAELELKARQAESVRFALCMSTDSAESAAGAQRILVSGINDRGNMVGAGAAHLKMSGEEVGAAMEMLASLWPDRTQNAAAKKELWPFGISGDAPVICCDGRAVEAVELLKRFCLLKSCGVNADLVYLTDEQGEYYQPVSRRLIETLSAVGLEALIGAPCGVHFAPISAASTIISRAAYTVGKERETLPPPPWPESGAPRAPGTVPPHEWRDGGFEFTVCSTLPGRVWQNVMSNGSTGYIAADSGCGCMWYENAREMRINQPCADISAVQGSEALWVESQGRRISLFAANDGLKCSVRFAPGMASWEKVFGSKLIKTTAFIPAGADARVIIIEGAAGLRLRWALRVVMGGGDAKAVKTGTRGDMLTAENAEAYLPGAELLALCSQPCELSCDYSPPALVMTAAAGDVTVIVCGCGGEAELRALAEPSSAFVALSDVRGRWNALSRRVGVASGCAALDDYMNTWAVYQCIACRLEGRSSLYQSGGAIGFRDQLQDAVNMLLVSREYARERIIDCCRHQYAEGDVMHWWHCHPEGDRGVRTRCSDDLLWLVWAVCEYTEKTGDYKICGEEAVYLSSPPLEQSERDRYETPRRAGESASVLEHARAALELCIRRGTGAHGLPRMGSGDWNDGLDEVKGESVWLAWFLKSCAERFAALLEHFGKPDAARFRRCAQDMAEAAEAAWAGRWYARGYYANGQMLGGAERIDSVAQSWAVLAGSVPDSNRPEVAVDSAVRMLVDRAHSLVRLFDPPYTEGGGDPGYIVSYGEGFRENGGQYTHGAIWLAMACFRLGRCEDGWDILSMLLPARHDGARYEAEPFVLAADVYSAPGHEGEAGWSWYTGSAGWYFRAVYEEMLGLKLSGGKLTVQPHLPGALRECRAFWTDSAGVRHEICIRHGGVTVDGKKYGGEPIG